MLVKIPATVEGLPAITETLEGRDQRQRHADLLARALQAVIEAYIAGVKEAKDNGHDITKLHSVASFFVSRVDSEIDKRLKAIDTPEAKG